VSGYDSERINRIGIKVEDIPRSDFFRKPFAFRDMTSRIRRVERWPTKMTTFSPHVAKELVNLPADREESQRRLPPL
jgi:hypothetical protein